MMQNDGHHILSCPKRKLQLIFIVGFVGAVFFRTVHICIEAPNCVVDFYESTYCAPEGTVVAMSQTENIDGRFSFYSSVNANRFYLSIFSCKTAVAKSKTIQPTWMKKGFSSFDVHTKKCFRDICRASHINRRQRWVCFSASVPNNLENNLCNPSAKVSKSCATQAKDRVRLFPLLRQSLRLYNLFNSVLSANIQIFLCTKWNGRDLVLRLHFLYIYLFYLRRLCWLYTNSPYSLFVHLLLTKFSEFCFAGTEMQRNRWNGTEGASS